MLRIRGIMFHIAVCLVVATRLQAAALFTTYAAWSDTGNNQQGRMYIYTGNFPSTDVSLYNATTPNVAMTTMYCGFPINGVGPYQPVFEVGSCPVPPAGGFGNNYFRCQSTNPIVWEVEEPIFSTEADSHDFLAAADTNKYIGSVFMTYCRHDGRAGATSDYGDQCAVFNPGPGTTTVTVRRWTGTPPAGSWGAVLITSPPIPALGVWMFSPSAPGTHDRGGTLVAGEGHYRFDISGGTGMLYKGNTFGPYIGPGNRDNLVLFGPDIATGSKVGTDLLGVVVTDGGAPHIVINNQSASTASYDILKFNPTTPGFFCAGCGIGAGNEYLWPVDGDDPSGSWSVVSSGTVSPLGSAFYNAGALTNAGYYRVRSTGGQPLSAEFGSAILQQTWCDGDYMYASDTRLAFGRSFNFGGKFFSSQVAGDPVQLQVVAPLAGTTVHAWVNGSVSGLLYNLTQTSVANDVGLAFPFVMPGNTLETWDGHVVSDKAIYSYVMSTTDGSTKGGETFFSVPPPINPLVITNKSVNHATASLGDTLTYTLTAENVSVGGATNVVLTDTLPPGVAFVSASPAPTLASSPLYAWNLGTVNSNLAVTVSLVVAVTAGTQLEIKHNTSAVISDLTPFFQSNDAPFTILIPGANLQKSVSKAQAMPGDTLTYILNYTNTQPPLPGTPKLNLEVQDGTSNSGQSGFTFRVTNYSGSPININDLTISYWVSDDTAPSAFFYANDYGGGTTPYVWGGPAMTGTATAWNPPQNLPSNRQANVKLSMQPTSGQMLPDLSAWDGIQQRWYMNYPQVFDNPLDDYSHPTGSGSYVNDHHFALYYQGKLVTEYLNAATPDPNTGLEPAYMWLEDFVPGNINYLGNSANGLTTAANTSNLPQLTWTEDAVAPASTKSYTWWGVIAPGTPGGTVIPNEADDSVAAGPGISNRVETLVGSATVTLVKSINKSVFSFGETVTYCLAWSNTGTAAVNIQIYDTVPYVLTYVGSDNGGSLAGGVVTWNLGSQAANTSGSVCFWGKITSYPLLPPWRQAQPETVLAWMRQDWLAGLPGRGD